VKTGKKP